MNSSNQLPIQFALQAHQGPLDAADLQALNDSLAGLPKLLGLKYERFSASEVAVNLHVNQDHLQNAGMVTGAIFASMSEIAATACAIALTGMKVQSVGAHNSFFETVTSGVVVAIATPIFVSAQSCVIEVCIRHRETLVAKSSCRFTTVEKHN